MAHISPEEANAWLESTKLSLSELDDELEWQITSQIMSRLSAGFNTSTWTDATTTPRLVRTIIAMYYVAAVYDRTYSDNTDDTISNYATILRSLAESNITGLLNGTITLEEDPTANADIGSPVFFPNDASSAQKPTRDNPSDGGPSFMMGMVF